MQTDVASALAEAANLLLVGMTVVFLFLSMLIGAIKLISWLNSAFPEKEVDISTPTPLARSGISDSQVASPKIVAAISAAIRQHRRAN